VFINFLLQSAPGSSNPILGFLPILLIFAIFYFLLFLPMQRQKKKHQQMLKELVSGAKVLTNGGMIGTVVKVEEDSVVLRVKPDNIKIEIARSAVASLAGEEKTK